MKSYRRGIVLMVVLVVVTMLALGSLGFAELMLSEHRAAQTSTRQSQARSFAETGVQVSQIFLDRYPDDIQTAGGLYDNPQRFGNQLVAEEPSPRDRGKFTLVAPKIDDTTGAFTGYRIGLEDESAKINLAWLINRYDQSAGSASGGTASTSNSTNEDEESLASNAHAMLMGLPGMTDAIADAILDWIDPDDTPRDQGAESEFYNALQTPYTPRDGAPVSIEELLLVEGVTPQMLYGLDAEKMGFSSSDSTAAGALAAVNPDGSMDHGWAAYLTLWSAESTLKSSDGTPKINVNQTDMATLYSQLSAVMDPKWAQYIVFYRQGGGTVDSGGNADTTAFGTGRNTIGSMLDLLGAKVRVVTSNSTSATVLPSPFSSDAATMSDYLPTLFDNCTTVAGTSIPGAININQASEIVLMSIPGMTEEMAEAIMSSRQPDPDSAESLALPTHTCPAWPLIEGIMTLSEMKAILPYINAGGSVYSAHVIGHFEKGNPVARIEAILDATQHPARVLFWKDMSHLTDFRFIGETNSLLASLNNGQAGSQSGSQTINSSSTSTPGTH